jgi:uncharacterized damage-inducible protein DinB
VSLADHARLLLDYNEDANRRVLESALTLDDQALDRDGGASKGSIRGNLLHVLRAQNVWLSRWTGDPPADFDPQADRAAMRAGFEASDAALRMFAAGLTGADWDRVIDYTDAAGVAQRAALGVLITHVVNHGTLHRGEAGMLLAAHDRSPGDLDFVLFVLGRQPQA